MLDHNQYVHPMLAGQMGQMGMGMPRLPPSYSQAEVKRRRPYTHLACTQCKEKHQKCDGQKPVCSTCSMKQIECTYRPERNKKRDGESASQEEVAYLRSEIYQWKERYEQLKKFVDENLVPFCANGMLPGFQSDTSSVDKQLYQIQLQQQQLLQLPQQQQLQQLQQLQQQQLQQGTDSDQLLPHSLFGGEGITGSGISQSLLMQNSAMYLPQMNQFNFQGGNYPTVLATNTVSPLTGLGELKDDSGYSYAKSLAGKPLEPYSYLNQNQYLYDPSLDVMRQEKPTSLAQNPQPLLAVPLSNGPTPISHHQDF